MCVCVCVSHSVVSNSLWPCGLFPTRLLCPWDSPSKNTWVGCPSLPQGIFLTQGSNLGLPPCRIPYHLNHQANSKCHVLRDSTYMASLKLQNCGPGEQISGFHEFWSAGSEREVGVPMKGPPRDPAQITMLCVLTVSCQCAPVNVLLVMMSCTADPWTMEGSRTLTLGQSKIHL